MLKDFKAKFSEKVANDDLSLQVTLHFITLFKINILVVCAKKTNLYKHEELFIFHLRTLASHCSKHTYTQH